MDHQRDREDLDEALRRCQAGLKAIEAARQTLDDTQSVYPTHLHLSAIELARVIELTLRVAMRNP